MLASLTCRLIAAQRGAWHEIAQLHDDDLPSPAAHGALVAAVSVLATLLSIVALTPTDFASALRTVLCAIAGCAGATGLAVFVVPRMLHGTGRDRGQLCRFASAASLPLSASGQANLLPGGFLPYLTIAVLCGLSYVSGSRGARVLLQLEGRRKARVAGQAALVATLPAVLAALLHAAP